MRLEKVLGLADFLGKRGEAFKMLAQGAQLLRDGQVPGQPAATAFTAPGAPSTAGFAAAAAPAAGANLPGMPDIGLDPDEWALMRIMVAAAQSDGQISAEEQRNILQYAQHLGATQPQLHQLGLELQQRIGAPAIVQSVDSITVRKLMYQCAFALVKSDSRVDPREVAFMTELAAATEISHDVLAKLVG